MIEKNSLRDLCYQHPFMYLYSWPMSLPECINVYTASPQCELLSYPLTGTVIHLSSLADS